MRTFEISDCLRLRSDSDPRLIQWWLPYGCPGAECCLDLVPEPARAVLADLPGTRPVVIAGNRPRPILRIEQPEQVVFPVTGGWPMFPDAARHAGADGPSDVVALRHQTG